MMQVAEQFPDFGIVSPLTTQLSGTSVGPLTGQQERRMFCLKYCLTRCDLPQRITLIFLFLFNLIASGLTHVRR